MKEAINFLNNIIDNDATVLVAVSGGPDSMALLDILYKLDDKNFKIIVAHVNHNIRKESKEEELLVKDYCDKRKIIFESMTIDSKIDSNFEMEARKIRYDFFEKLIKKYYIKYLLTAHHGDDLVETILMRISRGSILKGYKGINLITKKDNYAILRPLLYTTKQELIEYLDDNEIKYAIDMSNHDDFHTRNRYRHYMLPFLKEENKDIHLKYLQFSKELNLYDEFIDNYIINNCSDVLVNNEINVELFLKLDKLIQIKIIERLLNDIYDGHLEIITKVHVNNIIKLINRNKSNSKIDLPNNKIVLVEYGSLRIIDKVDEKTFDIILDKDTDNFIFLNEDINDKSNYILRINSSEIEFPLHIRSRKVGDKIEVKNFSHRQKVSDILTNSKIKYSLRQNMPIIVDNCDNILWIPGVKKSKFDKEKNEKYDIIIKYILNKEENNE